MLFVVVCFCQIDCATLVFCCFCTLYLLQYDALHCLGGPKWVVLYAGLFFGQGNGGGEGFFFFFCLGLEKKEERMMPHGRLMRFRLA